MVVILIVAIRSQAIFLIISRVARDFFIGMNLLDMRGDFLIDDRRSPCVTRTIVVGGHAGLLW